MFFHKIKQWSAMANMPEEFKKRIENLEGSFAVAYNVFTEFESCFSSIFKTPEHLDFEQVKQHRNRKQKSMPCTPLKMFEFCWTLFITIKCEDISYNNDLVTSNYLLIAICDWAFGNALLADRRDLLNSEFKGIDIIFLLTASIISNFNRPSS
jgi:retinoblastoma-like protein 1